MSEYNQLQAEVDRHKAQKRQEALRPLYIAALQEITRLREVNRELLAALADIEDGVNMESGEMMEIAHDAIKKAANA